MSIVPTADVSEGATGALGDTGKQCKHTMRLPEHCLALLELDELSREQEDYLNQWVRHTVVQLVEHHYQREDTLRQTLKQARDLCTEQRMQSDAVFKSMTDRISELEARLSVLEGRARSMSNQSSALQDKKGVDDVRLILPPPQKMVDMHDQLAVAFTELKTVRDQLEFLIENKNANQDAHLAIDQVPVLASKHLLLLASNQAHSDWQRQAPRAPPPYQRRPSKHAEESSVNPPKEGLIMGFGQGKTQNPDSRFVSFRQKVHEDGGPVYNQTHFTELHHPL